MTEITTESIGSTNVTTVATAHEPALGPTLGRPARLGLARLAAAVLVAWIVLDVGLRFAPPAWFAANPFPIAMRWPARGASFEPDFAGASKNYVGDAVLEANGRQTERRPPLRLTTDARGFRRNPYLAADRRPDVVLLGGDSFSYGAALSDEETLPAAITRNTGLGVYNGGLFGDDHLTLHGLDRLLAGLPGRPRTALLLVLEHRQVDPPTNAQGRGAAFAATHPTLAPAVRWMRARRRDLAEAQRRVGRWWDFSPVEIVTKRVLRRASNDWILPNSYAGVTRTLALPDGRAMIIRDYELQPARAGRSLADAPAAADNLARWRDSLAVRGVALRVLLVPSRYTVYGPWLERAPARHAILQVGGYLNRLDAELRARGIPTVNALPVFWDVVPDELRTGTLSFYREDNHWNAGGVKRIASVVADSLRAWDASTSEGGTTPAL